MQPENIIENWRQWGLGLRSRPVILRELHGGRSNHSFLLDSDTGKLVLRINGTASLLPGAGRDSEMNIWQAAARQGLAPPLLFVDTQNRFLLSAYIDSSLPSEPRTDAAFADSALALLEACHRLDVRASRIDYAAHIGHYWQRIEAGNRPPPPVLSRQRQAMHARLESLAENTPTGLCHHDPVIENFVGNPGRLYLIDWEYAATGLQIMDYAAFATEWQIDDATILAKTGFDPEHFKMARTLYQYLCSLWETASE